MTSLERARFRDAFRALGEIAEAHESAWKVLGDDLDPMFVSALTLKALRTIAWAQTGEGEQP